MLLIIQPNDIHNKHSATDNTVAYFFDKKSLTTRFGGCNPKTIDFFAAFGNLSQLFKRAWD